MKRFCLLWVTLALWAPPALRAQDAATQERFDKLSGQLEDVIASQKALLSRVNSMERELQQVRQQASRPAGNFAAQEDLKRLAEAVKTVDRKRLEDYDKIAKELRNLGKSLGGPSSSSPTKAKSSASTAKSKAKSPKSKPKTQSQ